ncbi:uncharacterized protein M437DRAFT_49471, partial [Aureobasidium melanogenum CBS 110374]
IVAIHGIGAHPDDTWCKLRRADLDVTRPENYVNWLHDNDMLPSRIPNARIMRYGYRSAWHGAEVTEQGTSSVAPRVIKTKTSQRCQKRPLIIVAHCFGGLVVLKVRITNPALSKYDQGHVQPEVLKILDPGNELLHILVDKFGEIRSKPNKAHVACFYETMPCDIGRIIGQAGKNVSIELVNSFCSEEL